RRCTRPVRARPCCWPSRSTAGSPSPSPAASPPRCRAMPEGHLAVVGLGPGDPAYMCGRAHDALRAADTVIGYRAYTDALVEWWPDAPVEPWPIGAEVERATEAVRRARAGERIAVVSSGDAGVYGMAGLVLDVLYDLGWDGAGSPEVEVVPGITAALAAAARLGAPL